MSAFGAAGESPVSRAGTGTMTNGDLAHEIACWSLIVMGIVSILFGGIAIVRILLRPGF